MEYLEEYGRGIDIVYARMRESGLLEPIFKNVANSFKVTLLGNEFLQLNERQLKAWIYLQEGSGRKLTAAGHQKFYQVSRAAANTDLTKLVNLGLIRKIGSGPNIYYESTY